MPEADDEIRIARTFIETFNRAFAERDLALLLSVCDPDVTWIPHRAGTEGEFSGHAGMSRYFADTLETFESMYVEVDELRILGDGRNFVSGTFRVRGVASGVEVRVPMAGVSSHRNGLATYWKHYGDRDRALEAEGLVEASRSWD
jgi:ketosteroid isomerase-like protein